MILGDDPVDALAHDHRHLGELAGAVKKHLETSALDELVFGIERLRDELLTHFALEEEGLFPFVAARRPELAARIAALQAGHDSVCGTVSRLLYLAQRLGDDSERQPCRAVFERFEHNYAVHAEDEVAFLRELGQKLDADDRTELRAILAGL